MKLVLGEQEQARKVPISKYDQGSYTSPRDIHEIKIYLFWNILKFVAFSLFQLLFALISIANCWVFDKYQNNSDSCIAILFICAI